MCSILVANKSARKQLVQWGRRGKGGESDLLYLCSAVVNLTARDIFLSFFIEIWAGMQGFICKIEVLGFFLHDQNQYQNELNSSC